RPCSVHGGVRGASGWTAGRVRGVLPQVCSTFRGGAGQHEETARQDDRDGGHTERRGSVPRRQARVQGLMAEAVPLYTSTTVPAGGLPEARGFEIGRAHV